LVHRRTVAVCFFLLGILGCGGNDTPTTPTGSGNLVVEDLTIGTGAVAAAGDTLTVNYVGMFLDGRVFDSSANQGAPFTFRLGVGAVIAGWDQGIPGMRVGGKRRLTIPPELAYGSTGRGSIPPNTTLRFEVELLSIAGR
jgi:FKBP-type peptidyl-prolyl cis-trans isomerase FkpA